MAAPALAFKLSLSTGEFLRQIGIATAAVQGFQSVFAGLRNLSVAPFRLVRFAADLNDLAARANVAVGEMYQLRHAFSVAGSHAEAVVPVLHYMQRALGGVSEDGESTAEAFAELGLNFQHLRAVGPAQALREVVTALRAIEPTRAAFLAGRIFGRHGAQEALVLSRNLESFSAAMSDAERAAQRIDRFSAAADALSDSLKRLAIVSHELFAPLAERLANWGLWLAEAMKAGTLPEILKLQVRIWAVDLYDSFLQFGKDLAQGFIRGFSDAIAAVPRLVSYFDATAQEAVGAAWPKWVAAAYKRSPPLRLAGVAAAAWTALHGHKIPELGAIGAAEERERLRRLKAEIQESITALTTPRPPAAPLLSEQLAAVQPPAGRGVGFARLADLNELERVGAVFGRGPRELWARDLLTEQRRATRALVSIEQMMSRNRIALVNQ